MTFDSGINLLLGKNGAGKSSFLEAAGFALFDANLRTNKNTDAIKYGEKSAHITVEFEGNDGNEYIVERKIGTSSLMRLYVNGDRGARIEGKDGVLAKVKELTGIETNERTIYQDIITASQNKIVNVFGANPKDREKTFNRIFDTAIYRKIYENYAKEIRDEYDKAIDVGKKNIMYISTKMVDSGSLKNKIKEKKNAKNSIEKKYALLKKEIKRTEKELQVLQKTKQNINSEELKKRHKSELFKQKKDVLKKEQIALSKAEHSLDIVNNTREEFKLYEKENTLYEAALKNIEILEKKSAHVIVISKDIGKNKLLDNNLLQKIEQVQIDINRIKKDQENNDLELSALDIHCKKLNDHIDRQEKEVEEKNELLLSYTQNLNCRKNAMQNREILLSRIKEIQKECTRIDEIKNDILTLSQNKEELQKKIQKKKSLESKCRMASVKLAELISAKKELVLGQCPFLKEKCQNVEEGGSPEHYFLKREEVIEKEISDLNILLEEFTLLDGEFEKVTSNIAASNERLSSITQKEKSLQLIEKDIEIKQKDIQLAELAMRNCCTEEQLEQNKDFEAIYMKLNDEFSVLKEQIKTEIKNAKEKNNHKDTLHKKQKLLNKESLKLSENGHGYRDKLKKVKQTIAELNNTTSLIEDEIKDLSVLKNKNKEKHEKIVLLQTSYDQYTANIKYSENVDLHKKNILKNETNASEIENELTNINDRLAIYIANYSKDELEAKELIIKKLKKDDDESLEERIKFSEELNKLKNDLEINTQYENDINIANKEVHRLSLKLKLADDLRKKIGDMGKFVASRLMKNIEIKATENFRHITGRSEEIQWVTSEKESYEVYLIQGQERRCKFNLLSGGEQVAVALSLRAAIASLLTKARIAIFDEPTINLDSEKKIALSESLKNMMKDLQQAIIVTHDDTFREMAQKIIVLE